jgi:hypothetical protein
MKDATRLQSVVFAHSLPSDAQLAEIGGKSSKVSGHKPAIILALRAHERRRRRSELAPVSTTEKVLRVCLAETDGRMVTCIRDEASIESTESRPFL